MACSVTGVGEHVMRALLARDCADRMADRDVSVADACSRAIEDGILRARADAAFQTVVECTQSQRGKQCLVGFPHSADLQRQRHVHRRTGSRRTAACWR